jgi:hypothetical protein
MTKKEKKLILDFSLTTITKDDFLTQYPMDLNRVNNYVLETLEQAYLDKNGDDVEYALLLGFSFNVFSDDFVDILCKIIIEKWHNKHEDIALILQKLKSPKSVDCLYQTALMKLDYLSYDDTYALARKCIHALGDINTEASRNKLKLLAISSVPIIREKAEKQLHY